MPLLRLLAAGAAVVWPPQRETVPVYQYDMTQAGSTTPIGDGAMQTVYPCPALASSVSSWAFCGKV